MIAEFFTSLVSNLGYVGMFFVSFIGALSIFFPIPYTALILLFSTRMDPILLAISSGLGAGLGEFSGYLIGMAGRHVLDPKKKDRVEKLKALLSKYGLIIIFIFALTPLPDDLIFIPLGIMKYPLLSSLFACILGKILMSYLIASFGRLYASIFRVEENWAASIVSVLVLTILVFVMLKVDWGKFLDKIPKKD